MENSNQPRHDKNWGQKRILVVSFIGLPALFVVMGLAGYFWLLTSLPKTSGTVQIAGISSSVSIQRDENGIPHITAKTDDDAYFALGYVHAQDRFWQMEMMRRYGAGRLSEVMGDGTVGIDRWMRTLGLYRLAQSQISEMEQPVRRSMEAYARGVNDWLSGKSGLLGLEFAGFWYTPEPWKLADSLVWGKIMATRLGGNFRDEILRTQIAKRIAPGRVGEMWPAYPSDAPVTGAGAASQWSEGLLNDLITLAPNVMGKPTGASNFWAIGPTLTDTNDAILANDPHLGFSAPIMWYLADIVTPTLNIRGATVPGVPFHILGANASIAWGITSTQADNEDLFVEKLSGKDRLRYVALGNDTEFNVHQETIRVKGQMDQDINIRLSRHGPIISDLRNDTRLLGDDDHVVALAATYLFGADQTTAAFYQLNRATTWQEFQSGLRKIQGPVMNFVYADVAGNIGYQTAGQVPVRRNGSGIVPSPGWLGNTAWVGYVPFDSLPSDYNPVSSKIINANNRVIGDGDRYFISHDWAARYRADRIEHGLKDASKKTILQTQELQNDGLSLMAKDILPILIKAVRPGNKSVNSILKLLKNWNGVMARNRSEPLIFSTWVLELNKLIYADELGNLTSRYLKLRPRFLKSVLSRRQMWCDDVNTQDIEGCNQLINAALDRALDTLSEKYGSDRRKWAWGAAHMAVFKHNVFTRIPLLNRLADIKIASDGGNFTVNRGATRPNDKTAPFSHIHGPGFRAVYDLGNLHNSRFVIATGQSGNPLSEHYSDFVTRWRDGKYVKFRNDIRDGDVQGLDKLVLVPKSTNRANNDKEDIK